MRSHPIRQKRHIGCARGCPICIVTVADDQATRWRDTERSSREEIAFWVRFETFRATGFSAGHGGVEEARSHRERRVSISPGSPSRAPCVLRVPENLESPREAHVSERCESISRAGRASTPSRVGEPLPRPYQGRSLSARAACDTDRIEQAGRHASVRARDGSDGELGWRGDHQRSARPPSLPSRGADDRESRRDRRARRREVGVVGADLFHVTSSSQFKAHRQ